MFYQQSNFDIRCEWGMAGMSKLALISDVVIIVDVLSFSTTLDIAVNNGGVVFPYRWKDSTAKEYAEMKNARLADHKRQLSSGKLSLSPASLINIAEHTRLVLPSPNGSTLSLASTSQHTLAGCLRNCRSVAEKAMELGKSIAVIPAGERWEDGTLRPAIEDLIGAGAIINYLVGTKSPEAEVAQSAFKSIRDRLFFFLLDCSSGKELNERGFKIDVELAAQLNSSNAVPKLEYEAYRNCATV